MSSILAIAGSVLILLGLIGVRYADAVVRTQSDVGATPYEGSAEITDADRVQVTRGVGVVFTIVGFVLIVFGLDLL